MTSRLFRFAVAAVVLAAIAAGCGKEKRAREEELPEVPLDVNLVKNPSFEEWVGHVPKDWTLHEFEGTGERMSMFGRSAGDKRSGDFSFFLRGTFNVDKWMALSQRHPVPPGHRLWFAAEMKSKDLKKNRGQKERANIYVRFYDRDGNRVRDRYWADSWTRFLLGTADWRRIGRRIEIPKEARYAEIGLICQMTGYIYFDDVELVVEKPFPWRTVETRYVDFYYLEGHPLPDGAVEREARFVENCIEKFDLDPEPEDKLGYYYYPSDDVFKEIRGFKLGPEHCRMNPSKHELHTTKTFDDHEIIHLLLEPLGYPPFGLAEGAVFHVLGSWEGGRNIHMMVKDLLLNKRLPALHRIIDERQIDQIGGSIAVPGWASFCMWLIDRNGMDKFLKLYVATNEVKEAAVFNRHFKDVYGKEFDVMDREWRLWVLRYEPKI